MKKINFGEIEPQQLQFIKLAEIKIDKRKKKILGLYKEIEIEMQAIIADMRQMYIDAGADPETVDKSMKKIEIHKNIPENINKLFNLFK